MSGEKLGVAVVGYGYWGPNLVRNFTACPHTVVRRVVDRDEGRRAAVKALYPWVETSADVEAALSDPAVGAVAVVTPMAAHYGLAKAALEAGKHVLIEKPLTDSVARGEELIALARSRGRTLMVDHTFVFTGAVRKIKEYVDAGSLGRVLYFDSVRVNLGLFQPDSNVIWDLAPHDLSILDHVLGRTPRWVSATGARHYGPNENLAYMTVGFDDELIAHFHFNWVAPVKVRRIMIGGTQRMLVYDDMEPSEKIRLYDHGVQVQGGVGIGVGPGALGREDAHNLLVSYRTGDVLAPKLDGAEALRGVVAEFARACQTGAAPITDGAAGLRVVKLIEAAQRSLRDGSSRVAV
jgi:predicted dehydrogenase